MNTYKFSLESTNIDEFSIKNDKIKKPKSLKGIELSRNVEKNGRIFLEFNLKCKTPKNTSHFKRLDELYRNKIISAYGVSPVK